MGIPAYYEKPRVSFKDQEEGEIVLLLVRQHPVTNFSWLWLTFLLFLLPIFFWFGPFPSLLPGLSNLPIRFLFFLAWLWYQFLLGYVLVAFAGWFFNINLVTDRRILDVDYWGFLFFNVSETPLANIQDITYNISGLPQTIFNYGDIHIQTAGTAANFEFRHVPHPAAIHDLITDAMGGRHAIS